MRTPYGALPCRLYVLAAVCLAPVLIAGCVVEPPAVAAQSVVVAALDEGVPARTDWPDFRGPWRNGHASAPGDTRLRGLPLRWSETENVRWKTAIPHQGWSSPVVMDGRVWLTTATEDGRDFFVIALDAETGEIRLNKKLFHADNPEPLGNNINGYASPSPVVEAGRVYVHFGSYGTACLDAATGKVLWERRDLECRHFRGPGSSPLLYENLLILSFDGVDVQYVVALDKMSGETVWKTERSTVWNDLDANGEPIRQGDLRKAYCTPLVYKSAGQDRMITLGSYTAFAYDPHTGKEIWNVSLPGFTPAARPVYGNGHVYIPTGRRPAELWAIRVGGEGDVSDTHVSWKIDERVVPQEPSPLLVDGLLYVVSNTGDAACLEAATGEEVWIERIGGSHMASPLYADGRLYFFSVQGKTTVLAAGRTYEKLATNALDSGFMASPAVSGNALILRTKTHLYRIETEESQAAG